MDAVPSGMKNLNGSQISVILQGAVHPQDRSWRENKRHAYGCSKSQRILDTIQHMITMNETSVILLVAGEWIEVKLKMDTKNIDELVKHVPSQNLGKYSSTTVGTVTQLQQSCSDLVQYNLIF